MAKQEGNNIKLGLFVLAALAVLIVSFYLIGKNTNIFGSSFKLKTRFANLDGLMEGNNVLFSGIQAGTVKTIEMVDDTTIEVTMLINKQVVPYIHENAEAEIGTAGIIGNKIINIQPVWGASPRVKSGDILASKKQISTEDMLKTLSKTNKNIATISEALKTTVLRMDTSAVFALLNNKVIGEKLLSTLTNIDRASQNANAMTSGLNGMVTDIKQGKGAAGFLLTDTTLTGNLKAAAVTIRSASAHADKVTIELNNLAAQLNHDLVNGKGPLTALLRDSVLTGKLNTSLDNVQQGTRGFSEIIEALKHNFLVRCYFKKQEKKKLKEKNKQKSLPAK